MKFITLSQWAYWALDRDYEYIDLNRNMIWASIIDAKRSRINFIVGNLQLIIYQPKMKQK